MPSRRPPRGFWTWIAYRNSLAQRKGWTSYGEKRYYETTLDLRFYGPPGGRVPSKALVALATACCRGRGHEPEREGSLLCGDCNNAVNPREVPRPSVWQKRLWRLVSAEMRRDHRGRFVRAQVRKSRRTRLIHAGVPVEQLERRAS